MKKKFTLLFLAVFSINVFAQSHNSTQAHQAIVNDIAASDQ